ncbi:ABC transporter ATP-binding protein [Candidatus Acetothermia bacterium]|nr:ABC transporter ATP-binding protein [Candidatus Acetothermia bacterium]MBI3642705.1 ABC transporter ATP-binding protein [Candidatus Acetothermia bacterium]
MECAISFQNLHKTYAGHVEALKGLSLDVQRGEFMGLLGLNGAGKTTSINVIAGLVRPTSGSVLVNGFDAIKQYRLAHAQVGIAPQEEVLDSSFLNVMQILVYQAGYFGIAPREATKRADALLQEFGLWEKRKSNVVELSGGMKRRLILAKALIHDPPILILDEPTAGVDVALRHHIWERMTALNKAGKTILLTTHYLEEAEQLCKRIAILHNGGLVATGSPHELITKILPDQLEIRTDPLLKAIPEGLDKFSPHLDEDCLCLQGSLSDPQVMNALVSLVQHSYKIISVEQKRARLEDVFLQLTSTDKTRYP